MFTIKRSEKEKSTKNEIRVTRNPPAETRFRERQRLQTRVRTPGFSPNEYIPSTCHVTTHPLEYDSDTRDSEADIFSKRFNSCFG